MNQTKNDLIRFKPDFNGADGFQASFRNAARQLARLLESPEGQEGGSALEALRSSALEQVSRAIGGDPTPLQLALSVLFDLVEQGWEFKLCPRGMEVRQPDFTQGEKGTAKDRIRQALLIERNEQVNQPVIRQFIREMETRRLGPTGWVSIFNLMRDGSELADRLQHSRSIADPERRKQELTKAIQPYFDFVAEDAVCPHSGFRLIDVWRYFRYTWSTAYKSTPGRRMLILVRDAAVPFHPIIGIAALSSSLVQLTCRDEWIGWNFPAFMRRVNESPSKDLAKWILTSLESSIREIYKHDLQKDGLLPAREVKHPTVETIKRLYEDASSSIKKHHQFPKSADLKASQLGLTDAAIDWQKLATTPLYRAKRAKALARLLGARLALQEAGLSRPDLEALRTTLKSGIARRAIGVVLREAKGRNVGVAMMDITTCGAVAPYNAILGGKLVSMLMASPEVVRAYARRYTKTASVIASSMKGAPVVRKPQLVLLGTTSLYSMGSSQYNRIKIPAEGLGGREGQVIAYVPLGETLGYGSFHFSQDTLDLIERFVARSKDGRRVNSIFGEGVNPRLRKIRQGFDELGLPEELLRHGSPRLVYMVPLAENFREILLGEAKRAKYILPVTNPIRTTERIAEAWRNRWLIGRIERDGILDAVGQHTLSYPVQHGARVTIPEQVECASLFDQ